MKTKPWNGPIALTDVNTIPPLGVNETIVVSTRSGSSEMSVIGALYLTEVFSRNGEPVTMTRKLNDDEIYSSTGKEAVASEEFEVAVKNLMGFLTEERKFGYQLAVREFAEDVRKAKVAMGIEEPGTYSSAG
ncbi:hypothetical protein LC612_28495 [Nostoc sp. CHAB 5834]|nr:hypothetical protein [Nostoc sp. CHAB 5834]